MAEAPSRGIENEVVANRFVIEALAGSGGMARVYRAKDEKTGGLVALKVMHPGMGMDALRFEREAELIAKLSHPGIVGYVSHGNTSDGSFFLAMEWAAGETLAARIRAKGQLPASEAIGVGVKVAEALAAAHAAGIVHRDIKPSNLVIRPDGSVVLLDFGVARVTGASSSLTLPGILVGTPGYISPEQARGEASVGPRADLFSLGCVLYTCLVGHAPFRGEDLVAVLAKILFQATPRVRAERKDVHPELDLVIADLMAKDPRDRPADAAAAARALEKALALGIDAPTGGSLPTPGISQREARLCAMVFVGDRSEGGVAIEDATEVGLRYGGALEKLANGAIAVRWVEAASAVERAVAAARCALLLHARAPGVPVSLATVRGGAAGDEVVAAAIDRAAELVREAAPRSSRGGKTEGVRIDETTAGLLDASFDVRMTDRGLELLGEREVGDDARRLLGVAAPCVGRERELSILDATLAQVEDDGSARAVLVLADAGVGKTRLRQEWVRRLRAREQPPHVWMGRGDPLGTRSPYGLVAQALRRAMGIRDDEALEVRQARVRERVRAVLGTTEADRVVTFVSELVGAPLEEADSAALAAARRDRLLMGDQLRRAFIDFLFAEAQSRPIVLVLEDPQWGDAATLRLVDSALAVSSDLPFLVVALARPAFKSSVPSLWSDRRVQEIKLEELSKKSSERLVRAVLPATVPAATVDRVVALAQGNAFFLEELVRAVAEGKGDHLPDSVLAVVESRLERLEPEARRLLRAASVFGQFFWPAGVAAVLGDADDGSVAAWLNVLVHREVVTERAFARFADQTEYTFRHALVRDAAYAMLTDQDRAVAHRAAASWLEAMGEQDAGVLASHFELGGDAARAAESYARAANQMIEANEMEQAIALAEKGLECAPTSAAAPELWLAIAEAERWHGDTENALRAAEEVLRGTPFGSDAHTRALATGALSAIKLGKKERAHELLLLARKTLEADASPLAARSAAQAGVAALFSGEKTIASNLLKLLVERRALGGADPATRATVHTFWAFYADADGDLEAQVEHFEHAANNHALVGNQRSELLMRANAAYARGLVGWLDEAEAGLRACFETAQRVGIAAVTMTVKADLASILEWQGQFAEAREYGEASAAEFRALGDRRMESAARTALARALLRVGSIDEALAQARTAVEISLPGTEPGAIASATLAYASLKAGDVGAAVLSATRAYDSVAAGGIVTSGQEAFVRLVYARALQAAGRLGEARMALAAAHARVLELANRMRSSDTRDAFLMNHWQNAQILEWAKASKIE